MDRNLTGSLPADAYENIAGGLIAYCVIFLLLNMTIVGVRFYIRLRIIRKFGSDDIALGVTLFATFASVLGVTIATRLGLGGHIEVLSIDDRIAFNKLLLASSLGYHVAIILLKSTFLLQFRRIFPLPTFQRLCDIFLAFLAAWTVAGLVGGMTICLPLSRNWLPQGAIWECDQRLWFWMSHGVIHVITDLMIFIMPLPLLRTLPLPPLHKFVLIGVFSLGFFTCAISCIRLTTLRSSLRDPDVTWTAATTMFWSLGEVTCSIVCLCIPTLRPLLGDIFSGRRGDENIMQRGSRGFAFDAISLPSSVERQSPNPRRRQATISSNDGPVQ
ncbi:hypothetical protein C8A00DRAFT_15023 [Chaetomidium leptoderma]|uniref:Rhodopsin domain-containing protein n=1 Tax=Chaetomidium leptoderma TaxID=669021 RepID=A0AAN6VP18_9PEZI|nr:hypothetical protein C8A00DRAFT_15023 [Chaetomidium leptoderma]